jgi:hypothetical protein
LGIDRVTPSYWPSLKESLKFPQSVGVAGSVILQHLEGRKLTGTILVDAHPHHIIS